MDEPDYLSNTYVLWYDEYSPSKSAIDYESQLIQICAMDTVQKFWQVLNNVPQLSEISVRSSYHFMKQGVRPLWEDKANYFGGLAKLTIRNANIQDFWQEVLVFLVSQEYAGVSYDDSVISGFSVSKKDEKFYVFEIWTTQKQAPQAFVDTLFKALHEILGVKLEYKIRYQGIYQAICHLKKKKQYKACADIIASMKAVKKNQ